MNKVDGLWEDVNEGFYVLDQAEKWWRVDTCDGYDQTIDRIAWWIEDEDGKKVRVTPPGHKAVTYLYDPKTLIERTLDGKEIR